MFPGCALNPRGARVTGEGARPGSGVARAGNAGKASS